MTITGERTEKPGSSGKRRKDNPVFILRRSTQQRFFLLLFILVNSISMLLLGSLYQSVRRSAMKETENLYSAVLENTVRDLETLIKESLTQASTFFLDENVQHYLRMTGEFGSVISPEDDYRLHDIQKNLKTTKVNDPSIHSIYLFKFLPDSVITDRGVYISLREFEERPLFSDLRDRRIQQGPSRFLMQIRRDTAPGPIHPDGRNILSLIVPFNTLPKNGLLVFNIREEAFTDRFNAIGKRLKGESFLVTPEDVLIAPSDAKRKNFDRLSKFTSGYTGFKAFEDSIVFSYSNKYGMRLFHEVPKKEIYAGVLVFRNTLLSLWIVILISSVPLALWLVRLMYRPIERLKTYLIDHDALKKSDLDSDDFEMFLKTYQNLFERNTFYRQQLSEYQPLMKEVMLFQFMNDNRMIGEIAPESLHEIRAQFQKSDFLCIILRIDGYLQYRSCHSDNQVSEDIRFLSGHLKTQLPDIHIINHMIENEIILISNFSPEETDVGGIRRALQPVRLMFEDYLQRTITVAIGEAVKAFEQLPAAYRSAARAAEYRLIAGKGKVIRYEDLPSTDEGSGIPAEALKRLQHAVRNLDRDDANEALRECFNSITGSVNVYEAVTIACSTILKALTVFTDEVQIKVPENGQVGELVKNSETIEHIIQWFLKLLNRLFHQLELDKREKNTNYLEKIAEIIEGEYRNPLLQIADVAAHFNLSATYFGRFFSELTGQNFTNYVNQVRLRHAVELLTETECTVNQIAEEVGFNSTQYFIRVFKKRYRMTPRTYRIRQAEEQPAAATS